MTFSPCCVWLSGDHGSSQGNLGRGFLDAIYGLYDRAPENYLQLSLRCQAERLSATGFRSTNDP